MYSFLEIIGLATCVLMGSLLCIGIIYEIKCAILKLIKHLRDPYRCPNCGCIPLGYRSKHTNRKWSSHFCPNCGCNLIREQINQKCLAYNSNEWHKNVVDTLKNQAKIQALQERYLYNYTHQK